MGLFGKIVKTVINTATLPVSAAKDVFTLGNVAGRGGSFTVQQLQKIKDEADD